MTGLETFLHNIALGWQTAISPTTLLYCFLGVLLGTAIGVIPGIGALATMSLLIPFTFYLDPTVALVMLAGIYYGSTYGGSTASILLNLPGLPHNAVTCLDGYPMAQQGRAGVALFGTTVASFVGGSIGIVLLMVFSPMLVSVAREFRQPEYFSLIVMGLVVASAITPGTLVKGLAMVVAGILIGLIGTDIYTGAFRFTFGSIELMDGVTIVALAMGLFGVAEVITSIGNAGVDKMYRRIGLKTMVPTRDDVRRSWFPMVRGAGIGAFFGALPGAGGTISTFISYAVEKRISKSPSRFGKGAVEGIMAPEAANSAGDQTAFIPRCDGDARHTARASVDGRAARRFLGTDHEFLDRQSAPADPQYPADRHMGANPDDPVQAALSSDPHVRVYRRLHCTLQPVRRFLGPCSRCRRLRHAAP